jgi:hypothetical protein
MGHDGRYSARRCSEDLVIEERPESRRGKERAFPIRVVIRANIVREASPLP